jgi:glucose/arabinose dehydrogenase
MKKILGFLGVVLLLAVAVWAARPAYDLYRGARPLLRMAPGLPSTASSQLMPGKPPEVPLDLPDFLTVTVFAKGLSEPRDIAFSPGGTLLVSQPSAGTVVALPDRNQDGRADETRAVLSGLNLPHGLAFSGSNLVVAEETRLVRYRWNENGLVAAQEKILTDLPKGGRHFTRSVAIGPDNQVYVSVGSTCDTCVEKDSRIGVIVTDLDGTAPRTFAAGLRNSVFITIKPGTGELWGAEMGRDFLGDDLPPDEINRLEDGKNYGWPFCYGNRIYDRKFGQQTPGFCAGTQPPVFEIPPHSAPLGLAFVDSPLFPDDWQGDLLVAYHGSWNRSVPTGYKVVRVKLGNGAALAEDMVSGWYRDSEIWGRPVDLAFDAQGKLYLSDDRAGVIYRFERR